MQNNHFYKGGDVLSFLPKGLTACLHKIKTRKIVKIQIQIIVVKERLLYAYPRADTFVFVCAYVLTDIEFVNIYGLYKVLPENVIPNA